jgi:alkylation response protein AidB-like acyl-CoA dehydrogenase
MLSTVSHPRLIPLACSDCKIGAIYEGTSNIQLQTIAKALSKKFY